MHGQLLQLSPDKNHFPGANEKSVLWLAKIMLMKNSIGRGCDRYSSVDGTLVETEPWPGFTSRMLVLMSQLFLS